MHIVELIVLSAYRAEITSGQSSFAELASKVSSEICFIFYHTLVLVHDV